MSYKKAWRDLVVKFADGRPICNCEEAYLSPVGVGYSCVDGKWIRRTDMLVCQYGCSANQLIAKHEIAGKVCDLLQVKP